MIAHARAPLTVFRSRPGRGCVALVGLMVLVLGASADDDEPGANRDRPAAAAAPRGDLARLQGRWRATVRTYNPRHSLDLLMTIEGNRVTWQTREMVNGNDWRAEARLAIDETADPHTWDMTDFQTSRPRESLPDLHAIYRVEGDALTLCVPPTSDHPRPREFYDDSGQGPPCLVVFRRLK